MTNPTVLQILFKVGFEFRKLDFVIDMQKLFTWLKWKRLRYYYSFMRWFPSRVSSCCEENTRTAWTEQHPCFQVVVFAVCNRSFGGDLLSLASVSEGAVLASSAVRELLKWISEWWGNYEQKTVQKSFRISKSGLSEKITRPLGRVQSQSGKSNLDNLFVDIIHTRYRELYSQSCYKCQDVKNREFTASAQVLLKSSSSSSEAEAVLRPRVILSRASRRCSLSRFLFGLRKIPCLRLLLFFHLWRLKRIICSHSCIVPNFRSLQWILFSCLRNFKDLNYQVIFTCFRLFFFQRRKCQMKEREKNSFHTWWCEVS